MALLGKISAVLSANTQDFTRNLGTAKKELSDFAKRVRGIELNINTRALDGTLTKLQKFQRTVQEITNLRAKGIDLGIDPRKLEDQFRVFEDIGKPLTKLVGQIEGLSTNLQAGLYPALGEVQRGFQDIYRAIQNGEPLSNFTRKVDDLRGRLVSLSRVTAASADLGKLVQSLDADNVGASFAQPFAKSALQKSLELRAQAEKTPARARQDGLFADLAAEAERGAVRIERAAAKVFEIQLRIANGGPTTGRKEALASAQQQLNAFVSLQEGINRRLQTELRSVQIKDIISPQATTAADDLIKKLSTAVQTLRAVGGSSFEPLIAGAGKVADQFVRGEASASRLARAIDAVNAASNSLSTGKGLLDRTNSLLFSGTERERQRIQSKFDRERANADSSQLPRIERRRDIQLSRLSLNEEFIPRLRSLQNSAAELGSPELKKRADDLLVSTRQISKALRDADNSAKNNNIKASNEAYERANKLVDEQSARIRRLTQDIQTLGDARRQQDLFLQESGGRSEKLSQGARDAAADISVARQFRGQIASGSARIAIAGEIDRVSASVTVLQERIAQVAASTLGTDAKVREIDRLDNEVRQSTKGLAEFVSKLSDGAFPTQQIERAMQMARNTAGSLSARGAQVVQLAFQQAIFAVDDFISSTGGLEYKLRAIGNNITQFGLLIGQSGVIPGLTATTGLFLGLATVVGGQAFSAITRWATGAEEADRRSKALNDSLARQKSLAESLAEAFRSVGDEIARISFSDQAQKARSFQKDLENLRKKQREEREGRVALLDPDVLAERARLNQINKDLETASDPGRAAALIRDREDAVRREREAVQRANRPLRGEDVRGVVLRAATQAELAAQGFPAPRNPANFAARDRAAARANAVPLANDAEARLAQRQALVAEIERTRTRATPDGFLPGSGRATDRAILAQLTQTLERLDNELIVVLDDLELQIRDSSRSAAVAIENAQVDVAKAIERGVVGAAAFQAALDGTAKQLEDAQARLDAARQIKDPEERNRAVRQAEDRVRDIRLRLPAINEQAREIRLSRTFGGERTTSALSALQGGDRFANEYAALTARVAAAADAEYQARIELQQAIQSQDAVAQEEARQRLEAAQSAGDLAAAAAEAAMAMEQAVSRIRKSVAAALSSSEGIADDARKRFNERPTTENQQTVRDAERQLIEDRRRASEINNAIDFRRSEAQRNDPAVVAINRELEQIRQERERLAEDARVNGVEQDPASARDLADREAKLLAEREQRLLSLTQAEQQQADAIGWEIDARRRLIEQLEKERQFDEETRKRKRPEGDPIRGLDLGLTTAERAAQEFAQGIADINAAFDEQQRAIFDESNGVVNDDAVRRARENEAARQDRLKNFQNDTFRSVAPLLATLQDNVQNAILQGPSRAALNAADVTTMEGSRELNRLLRGDDPARDQDLVALQRQANAYLKAIADKDLPPVAK